MAPRACIIHLRAARQARLNGRCQIHHVIGSFKLHILFALLVIIIVDEANRVFFAQVHAVFFLEGKD